jgi:hypothetical protein
MPHRVAAVADQERILGLAGAAADASGLLQLGQVERVRRRLGAKLEIFHGDRAIGVALVELSLGLKQRPQILDGGERVWVPIAERRTARLERLD